MANGGPPKLLNLTDVDIAQIKEKRIQLSEGIAQLELLEDGGIDVTELLKAARTAHQQVEALYSVFIK